jgi:polyhydroxyalkanoate synthase
MLNPLKLPELLVRLSRQPDIAQTPSKIVHREDRLVTHYYPSRKKKRARIPVVILNSLINKYYILDLTPGRSFVEYLVGQGFHVYMVDWGSPRPEDHLITLADHVNRYIPNIIDAVRRHAKSDRVSVIGYCMGGTMALMHAALHPDFLNCLTLLAAPVDFDNDSLLRLWASPEYLDVDKLVNTHGNPPADLLKSTFMMLKPTKNLTKYVDLINNLDNEEFVSTFLAFDYWVNDVVSLPGETFRDFIKMLYQENRLIHNRLKLGRRAVKLNKLTTPVLNVVANHDDVVPRAASEALMNVIASQDKQLLAVNGGHHGISIGPSAVKIVWPHVAHWLVKHDAYED